MALQDRQNTQSLHSNSSTSNIPHPSRSPNSLNHTPTTSFGNENENPSCKVSYTPSITYLHIPKHPRSIPPSYKCLDSPGVASIIVGDSIAHGVPTRITSDDASPNVIPDVATNGVSNIDSHDILSNVQIVPSSGIQRINLMIDNRASMFSSTVSIEKKSGENDQGVNYGFVEIEPEMHTHVIRVTSVSLLAVQSLSNISPVFFIGLLQAIVPAVLMNIYIMAINQVIHVLKYWIRLVKWIRLPVSPMSYESAKKKFGCSPEFLACLFSLDQMVERINPSKMLETTITLANCCMSCRKRRSGNGEEEYQRATSVAFFQELMDRSDFVDQDTTVKAKQRFCCTVDQTQKLDTTLLVFCVNEGLRRRYRWSGCKDCTYESTRAMRVPKNMENVHACENWLPRGVMSAWRVGGMVHALEAWDHHECAGDPYSLDPATIDKVWESALKHGQSTVRYWWTHSMICDETYQAILDNCNFTQEDDSPSCDHYVNYAMNNEFGNIDQFSIYTPSCTQRGGNWTFIRISTMLRLIAGYDPCNANYAEKYYNRPDVQEALHANTTKIPYGWTGCSNFLIRNWNVTDFSMLPIYKELMAAGLARILSIDGSGAPQFPQMLQWILNNQLPDGSWGFPLMFFITIRWCCSTFWRVEYALKYPWHRSMPRLEARSYIEQFGLNDVWLGKTMYKPYTKRRLNTLSGGVLGTAEILFQSKKRGLGLSERLGMGFSCNGNNVAYVAGSSMPLKTYGLKKEDFVNIAKTDRLGPTISTSYTSSLGFTMQSGVLPKAYPYMLFKGIGSYGWPQGYWLLHGIIDKFKHLAKTSYCQAMILNMIGFDNSDGKITLDDGTNRIQFSSAQD
eukprot:Gb_22516 [translate_table: standard]